MQKVNSYFLRLPTTYFLGESLLPVRLHFPCSRRAEARQQQGVLKCITRTNPCSEYPSRALRPNVKKSGSRVTRAAVKALSLERIVARGQPIQVFVCKARKNFSQRGARTRTIRITQMQTDQAGLSDRSG